MFKSSEGQHVGFDRPRGTKPRVPWAVSLIALGVIAGVFLAYEAVERLWLTDTNMGILHLLHIIRGVGTSIVIGVLVGWYVLRKGGSIFPSADSERGQIQRKEHVPQDLAIHFSMWFIRMRSLACIVAMTLIIITITILDFLEERTLWPLIALVALLGASNIIYTLLLRRRLLIWCLREVQVVSDLVILTFMLHFSGGIENPMFLMYIFHVIIGGILLDRRKCYGIVVIASILFGTMAILEMSGLVEHYTLSIFPHGGEDVHEAVHAAHRPLYVWSVVGLQFIIMSLTAYFTTGVMDRLRYEERHAQVVSQRLKRVVQATGAGFMILDRRLRPLWLNKQIREWLDVSDASVKQRPSLLTQWIGGANGHAAKTLKDGRVRVVERQRVDSRGNKRFFQVTVAPLLDGQGDVYQVVELTQDITQKKLLEAEMMHSSKMAALGLMAAGVAHEVGNPLASISTRLRLLKEPHDEDFLLKSIQELENQISRIGRILHGVSQLARPGKVAWSACQVNSIVSETLSVLRLDRRAKSCEIQSDLAKLMPETTASKDELSQVFLNLGLNALEKMPAKGGTLTVRTSVEAGEIKISFADTGLGMSKQVLSKIFTPFFTTKEHGLGLGLYMAYTIINAHGGIIKAQSKLGVGTVITVILPVRAAKTPGA